jgi:hypothetical protein
MDNITNAAVFPNRERNPIIPVLETIAHREKATVIIPVMIGNTR